MTERMVEIPVWRTVRDMIKEAKGALTYSEFLVGFFNGKTLQNRTEN